MKGSVSLGIFGISSVTWSLVGSLRRVCEVFMVDLVVRGQ